ncbi:gephyrin-like molybdotransferase Glp [Stappia stellulata]|uniref:molybdopterin molybdotransferase MoeA n=1 Tax=Stappia stellulata TaxID=71235 RepID=UPI000411127B|nr:gephyrin-like molybdotransferase Glp [Stappia stellulata]
MPSSRRLIDDCFLHDKDRLRHQEALEILKSRVSPVSGKETVPLAQAAGRILAEAVVAPHDVPGADNAAVDGYVFCHADHAETGGFFLLQTRIAAGHPVETPLRPGAAARIFTGALIPPGADTVAMQEDCETHAQDGQSFVIVPQGLKPGANRRRAGEDLTAGTEIVVPGTRLRPQDLAAIASTGMAQVPVHMPVRVALMSTGDEIRRPGESLPPGGVYDSNHFLLRALLEEIGASVTDYGVLADDADTLQATLSQAAASHDAILTTGGASRGEEDHMVTALDTLGSRHMWQLAIKPGRPMSFGQIGDCVTLGLPGNPVAAMICFLLYVRPVLSVLGGGAFLEPRRFQIPANFAVAAKKPDRREFYRGILERDSDGRTVVRKFDRDGSGLITGLREADGLIEIPEAATEVTEGQLVDFLPFAEFGLSPR